MKAGPKTDAEIVMLPTDSLRKNLKNISIYGDAADQEFVDKVRRFGIRNPLKVANDRQTLIGGQRRWQSAKILKIKEIPCIVLDIPPDPSDPRFGEIALIDNEHREKTIEVKAREFAWWKEIESKLAADRKAETQAKPGEKVGAAKDVANLPPPTNAGKTHENDAGKAREKAADRVGMKPRTAEKAAEVVEKIDECEAAGETEKAEELRETLNTKSVSAAHKKATEGESNKKPKSHFDDGRFERAYGPLVKVVAERNEWLGQRKSVAYQRTDKALAELLAAWKDWQKKEPV